MNPDIHGRMGVTSLRPPTSSLWANGYLGLLCEGEESRSVQVNAAPGVCKYNRAGKPETVEQADAELTLQSLDVMRHAGLRIVKLICGTIEAHGGDYGHERFEVLQVKHITMNSRTIYVQKLFLVAEALSRSSA